MSLVLDILFGALALAGISVSVIFFRHPPDDHTPEHCSTCHSLSHLLRTEDY